MNRLLAAACLAFAPAAASAEGAYDLLRALGGNDRALVQTPRAVPAQAPVAAVPLKADVSGEGVAHGMTRGARSPGSVPIEGDILVTGPDGATGRIKVYGAVPLHGTGAPNARALVSGSGPLYKDGKVVGEAQVTGNGPANVNLMGGVARASALLKVTGEFKPAR